MTAPGLGDGLHRYTEGTHLAGDIAQRVVDSTRTHDGTTPEGLRRALETELRRTLSATNRAHHVERRTESQWLESLLPGAADEAQARQALIDAKLPLELVMPLLVSTELADESIRKQRTLAFARASGELFKEGALTADQCRQSLASVWCEGAFDANPTVWREEGPHFGKWVVAVFNRDLSRNDAKACPLTDLLNERLEQARGAVRELNQSLGANHDGLPEAPPSLARLAGKAGFDKLAVRDHLRIERVEPGTSLDDPTGKAAALTVSHLLHLEWERPASLQAELGRFDAGFTVEVSDETLRAMLHRSQELLPALTEREAQSGVQPLAVAAKSYFEKRWPQLLGQDVSSERGAVQSPVVRYDLAAQWLTLSERQGARTSLPEKAKPSRISDSLEQLVGKDLVSAGGREGRFLTWNKTLGKTLLQDAREALAKVRGMNLPALTQELHRAQRAQVLLDQPLLYSVEARRTLPNGQVNYALAFKDVHGRDITSEVGPLLAQPLPDGVRSHLGGDQHAYHSGAQLFEVDGAYTVGLDFLVKNLARELYGVERCQALMPAPNRAGQVVELVPYGRAAPDQVEQFLRDQAQRTQQQQTPGLSCSPSRSLSQEQTVPSR